MRRFSQINFARRASHFEPSHDPVLTPEDEAYFQKLTAQPDAGDPAPLPDGSLTTASPVGEDAQNTPLPQSPTEEASKEAGQENNKPDEKLASESSTREVPTRQKKQRPWSRLWRMSSVMNKDRHASDPTHGRKSLDHSTKRSSNADNKDTNRMPQDMTDILERLNLSADDNHVVSVNEETQELLRKFKLIFKDLVNGVPTAYHDLEMLLENGNKQLQQSYSQLPGFIQKLIKMLPEKLAKNFGPEALAAASEKAGTTGAGTENMGKTAAAASKMGLSLPGLKEVAGNPAAIVGMLRSIMAFLKTRFPAFMGMNVLWSLALFILLFVLWYCHKRGREVRLENERLVTESEAGEINDEAGKDEIRPTETLTTTAPPGASTEEVREGVEEAQQSREVAGAKTEQERTKENRSSFISPPTRSKSKLALWSKSKPEPASNIEPYPGT